MPRLRPFTVFRRVPGGLDFAPAARIEAEDLRAATDAATDAATQAHAFAPVVCHAHTGRREPVDFSLSPPPVRRSRRHAP